jgi:hypothetical protein
MGWENRTRRSGSEAPYVVFVLGFLGSQNSWDDPGRTASGSRPSCLGGMPKAAGAQPATHHPQPWFDATGDADLQRALPRWGAPRRARGPEWLRVSR